MSRKLKTGLGICIFIAAAAMAAFMFFQNKPMVENINNPSIAFIHVTAGRNGETYSYDLSESEISDELNHDLISLFLNTKMRNTFVSYPENYTVSDGSVHITVKVLLDNSDCMSMFVNLCTVPQYNSAQFTDTHYHIVNDQKLYQDVYKILSLYDPNTIL